MDDSMQRRRLGYRVVWIASAVGIVVAALHFGHSAEVVEAVAGWQRYQQKTRGFSVEGPANWRFEASGPQSQTGMLSLTRTDLVFIKVADDELVLGSLLDMARATSRGAAATPVPALPSLPGGGSLPSLPPNKPVWEQMHAAAKSQVTGSDAVDFRESPAQPVQIGGLEAAVSDFTYTKHGILWESTPMCGMRATCLGQSTVYTIVCECPKSSWETLKPVFQRVINSFAVTKG